MTVQPITKLDQRFSDPGATAVPWEGALRAIATAEIFWITTVLADGRPYMTPLVAV